MKALAVVRGEATAADLEGRILCHDVRDGAGRLAGRKGQRLDDETARLLLGCPVDEIHLLELGAGDLHEEPAGARIARAAAGDGIEVTGYAGGQWTLASRRRGLLKVRRSALATVNSLAGVSVYTLYDLQPVEPGEGVGRAKVTPLVVSDAVVTEAERVAGEVSGLLSVAAFRPSLIGAVVRESLDAGQRQRFEGALAEKVTWLGSRLLPVRYAPADAAMVAADIEALVCADAGVIVVAGASALDPLDPVFLGIERAGGRMVTVGVPAHPGSLLFLAWRGEHPIVGMPTCGMFSQATTFDLVLPRLLTGERLTAHALAGLGHGGLLSQDSAWRFPAYRQATPRGALPE